MTAMAGKTTGPNRVVLDDRLKLLSLYAAICPEGVTALELPVIILMMILTLIVTFQDALSGFMTVRSLPILASNALFLPNRMLMKMG